MPEARFLNFAFSLPVNLTLLALTAQKMKFSIKVFFSKFDKNPQKTANIVKSTEENLNGKLNFLCSVS